MSADCDRIYDLVDELLSNTKSLIKFDPKWIKKNKITDDEIEAVYSVVYSAVRHMDKNMDMSDYFDCKDKW